MDVFNDCAEALETLAAHEAAISEFYLACAGLEGADRSLWGKLASEEAAHAGLLRSAKDSLMASDAQPFDPASLAKVLAESETKFIRKELERLRSKPGYALADALKAARMIEASFFENRVFDALSKSPAAILREAAKRLLDETRAHLEELNAFASALEERGKQPEKPQAEETPSEKPSSESNPSEGKLEGKPQGGKRPEEERNAARKGKESAEKEASGEKPSKKLSKGSGKA